MKRFLITWLLGGIATVIAMAVISAFESHGWWGYLTLVRHGAVAEAMVTRTDPRNHCLAEYTFVIDDWPYQGGTAECSAKVGEKVLVTYLPESPYLSCMGDARDRLNNELSTFAAGGVIFPPIVILAWRRRRKTNARHTHPDGVHP